MLLAGCRGLQCVKKETKKEENRWTPACEDAVGAVIDTKSWGSTVLDVYNLRLGRLGLRREQ